METSSPVAAAATDCNALGGLFHIIINDLRGGANNWDDLLLKANKFHVQLKSTITASTAFLDSFQKIADMATTTRGGTKEIGSAFTRLCLRHRSVEAKLKSLTSSLQDSFILPLSDRVEDWKKLIQSLDKDHSKELKRLKQLRKKQSSADSRSMAGFTNSTFRIKRHPRSKLKTDFPRIGSMYDMDRMIESVDNKEKYFMLEEVERNFVRRALIEERSHYCHFFNLLKPVIEEEISMLQEITHLEEIVSALTELTFDPYKLPQASESLLTKLQLNDTLSLDLPYTEYASSYRSRKSSISSINSINSLSTDSISLQNCKSSSQPNITPEFRPKSIASQDSGFISHDYNVPNFGRLTIKTKEAQNGPIGNGTAGKTLVCTRSLASCSSGSTGSGSSNSSDGCCHLSDCKQCQPSREYASREQIFANKNNGNQPNPALFKELIKQPIYVNMADQYCMSANGFYNFNTSDGSVTPTNQDSNENGVQIVTTSFKGEYGALDRTLKPSRPNKPCPPKPPVRQSSTLSTPPKKLEKAPTRIYVVQEPKSVDFPPPPPEAYIDYHSTISNNDQLNNNTMTTTIVNQQPNCCEYSIPNLVYCEDANCLKDIKHYDHRSTISIDQYCTKGYVESIRNSFVFEPPSQANNSEYHSKPLRYSISTKPPSSSPMSAKTSPNRKYQSTNNLHKPAHHN